MHDVVTLVAGRWFRSFAAVWHWDWSFAMACSGNPAWTQSRGMGMVVPTCRRQAGELDLVVAAFGVVVMDALAH